MQVIPVQLTDQQKPIHNIRVRSFFILDGHLDEEILRNALDCLIRDHWRKLGARLVTSPKDGLLEYHLPDTFEEKYVLFNWSSHEYDDSIHNIVSLPKPTPPDEGVTLHPHVRSVEQWLRPADWPFERKDEPPDAPLLYVHMSCFSDATVIAISCPHVVADQFGVATIMKAWLDQTKGEAPPSMIGASDNVLPDGKSYTDYRRDEVVRKGRLRVRRKMEYAVVILGFIPELIAHRKEDPHTLFLPLPLVQTLCVRHAKSLTDKYGNDPGISHGDIISAILLKFSRMFDKSTRMMALSQTVNLRGRVPQLNPDHGAFIHNALHYGTARFRLDPSMPISEIAYKNRQAIIRAVDSTDIEIALAATREMVRRRQSTHICEPFDRSFNVSNWSAAWKRLDFSSAVEGWNNEKNEPVTPKLLVLGEGSELNAPRRYTATVLCKTTEGYWCSISPPQKSIKLIKEYLKKDPMLENF